MVISSRTIHSASLILVGLLTLASGAFAEVIVSVDRYSVDLNESFILEITLGTDTDLEPDLSVLDDNFYRGQLSQLSNTSIINGQISRSRTWTVALMAKTTGRQSIPAISIGSESSKPISITINEPTNAPLGEADVFIVSEVDQTETYVQSQILYRFKVYRAVETRQELRRDPIISGAEVLLELAGEERTYKANLNGRAYDVRERVLAIYPQSSGEIEISPARFEARIFRDRQRITGRKVFASDAHTIKVLPIPAPPDDFPNASWFPARDVQLSEEWSRDFNKISTGEPITRKVMISALGQIETQIPALLPPNIEGMKVYADKPDLSRQLETKGIRGFRRDQYAMIGVRGGTIELPKLEVPWWNIEADEWQVATLPSRKITVNASATEAALPLVPQYQSSDEAAENVNSKKLVDDGFWKLLSQLLGGVWLLTIFFWWLLNWNRHQEPKASELPPIYKRQAKLIKMAKRAATAGDKTGVREALLEWAELQWPKDAPKSIGELAKRVASPLSEELSALSISSYGSVQSDWDGSAMATAIRSINVFVKSSKVTAQSSLPPLMPRDA
ncbi:MAG: BatD family protein [Woeseiaceae bacterium]|nr:BatD family protein [Woeseiaceae bacterium]